MARILVGTSGYMYRHWRGVLYPEGLAPRRWLERYATRFDTVEINATFYRLPSPESVERWRDAVPEGFTFAVKGSRYLTHLKRLIEVDEGLRRFYGPVARFGHKLGPVLWQLPPSLGPDLARLDRFLSRLPAGRRAVEFRDPAWYGEETCAVLDRHGAAFCEHDLVSLRPSRPTGGFRYVRFHGTSGGHAGRYGARALRPHAADYVASATRGVDVYVYFNNDPDGHAVRDALDLLALVGGGAGP